MVAEVDAVRAASRAQELDLRRQLTEAKEVERLYLVCIF
jgi:hypothetical protein